MRVTLLTVSRLMNPWPSDPRSNWNLEMLVVVERGKPELARRKTLRAHNLWLPAGIEPVPHWWEASALTTAPSLLPLTI